MRIRRLTASELLVMSLLSRSTDGLHTFSLYRRLSITPHELARVVLSLSKLELITADGLTVRLTDKGADWTVANRRSLSRAVPGSWRQKIPAEAIQPRLPVEQPYVPLLNKLDKSLLPFGWHAQLPRLYSPRE